MAFQSKCSAENEPVRPDRKQIARVLSQSESIWYTFLRATIEREELPSACFEPWSIIKRVPAVPDGSTSSRRLKKRVGDGQLVAFGHSAWDISGCEQCDLDGHRKNTGSYPLVLGVTKATSAKFYTGSGCARRGITTAIVAAIAYIFSKRLIELQGHGEDSLKTGYVYYTDKVALNSAKRPLPTSSCTSVIGDAGYEASRWWQALLATGQG